ncbi:MAG: two-component system response regulator CreB [Gammaproteobacteria bacterium]
MADIVIVEDEPGIAANLRYALERDAHNVHHCLLGTEGIEAVRAQPCDLVILDVGLPDASGFEVCRRIRAFSDVPIIFLTARGDEVDRVVGLEIGADDYVVKPFSVRELIARVQVVLRRRGARALVAAPAAAPGLVLDERRARIAWRGQALDLTRYEYLVLKLLMSAPGRVYSRAQIMDHVWPTASGSGDRTVDTHIKSLRAKIKSIDPLAEPIATHRGLGYSLTDSP